jgi:hypothetical protein
MNENKKRMECLKLAVLNKSNIDEIIAAAEKMYAFLNTRINKLLLISLHKLIKLRQSPG